MHCFFLILLLPYFTKANPWSAQACPESIKQHVWNGGPTKNTELEEIYKTLTTCSNLGNTTTRILHLKIDQGGCVVNGDDRWNFDFQAGAKLPSLHELHLEGYQFSVWQRASRNHWYYARHWIADALGLEALRPASKVDRNLPGANLKQWKAAMDWTELKDLSLEDVDPVFLSMMTGELPALNALKLGSMWPKPGATNVTDFIDQLQPLRQLSLHGYTKGIDLDRVLERHGATLDALEIREWERDHYLRPTLSFQEIDQIRSKCPSLSTLSLDINRNGTWPYELLDALAANGNLSSLALFFELGLDIHQNDDDYGLDEYGLNKTRDFRTTPRGHLFISGPL